MLLDHVSVNKTNAAGPALGSGVQNIVHLELGVFLRQKVELSLQDNVLLRDVGEDEVDLGLVLGVLDNGTDDLYAFINNVLNALSNCCCCWTH